jgi:hypothetical protein
VSVNEESGGKTKKSTDFFFFFRYFAWQDRWKNSKSKSSAQKFEKSSIRIASTSGGFFCQQLFAEQDSSRGLSGTSLQQE